MVPIATTDIKNIPTLPAIVMQIIRTTNDPTSSARDLNKIITNDQAIAAKVLQMANSPFYGLSSKVNNLNRAITLLGFNTVRSLALSISMVNHFRNKSASEHFNRSYFWEHSLGVAVIAKLMASKDPYINADEAYMSGLLHDLGIIILDQFFQEEFSRVWDLVVNDGRQMIDAEREVCGKDHAEFAAEIAEGWKYPEFLVTVIGNHHNSTYSGDHEKTVQVVYLANCLEYRFNENADRKDAPVADQDLLQQYCEEEKNIDMLQARFEAEMEKNQEILRFFQ